MDEQYYFVFDNTKGLVDFLGVLDEFTDVTWASGAKPLEYKPHHASWYFIVISSSHKMTFDTAKTLEELQSYYKPLWHDVIEGPGHALNDFIYKYTYTDVSAAQYDSIEKTILECIAYTGETKNIFDCVGDAPAEFVIGFS